MVPGRLHVIVEVGHAFGKLNPASVDGRFDVHHDPAIVTVPVRPGLARQACGRIGPGVAGLAAARQVEQKLGCRVGPHRISHPLNLRGIVRAEHNLAGALALKLDCQLLPYLGAAIERVRRHGDGAIPQLRLEHCGVQSRSQQHGWRRLRPLAILGAVLIKEVQRASGQHLQLARADGWQGVVGLVAEALVLNQLRHGLPRS